MCESGPKSRQTNKQKIKEDAEKQRNDRPHTDEQRRHAGKQEQGITK